MTARLMTSLLGATVLVTAIGPPGLATHLAARQTALIDPAQLASFRWRHIGPSVAGRVTAMDGAASTAGVFFVGLAGAGLWRTTDYGQHWAPVFDAPPVGHVGAIAIASSNAKVIYAGTGDGRPAGAPSVGGVVYRSEDAGGTFAPTTLAVSGPVVRIAIDPGNADHLLVAVGAGERPGLGGPGLYRSTNGGRTFQRVVGATEPQAIDVTFDPSSPAVVYALATERRAGGGASVGIFKSSDGGASWRRSERGVSAAHITAETSTPGSLTASRARLGRVYALLPGHAPVLYRSDDAGESWQVVGAAPSSGDIPSGNARVVADPSAADVVYLTGEVIRRSTDGGASFTPWPRRVSGRASSLWLHPTDPNQMLVGGDWGPVVSVNGGETWSDRSSLPAADVLRVSTDSSFPYRVCGPVFERGVLCGNGRWSTEAPQPRDWSEIPIAGAGPVTSDPLDADVLYTSDLTRIDRRTGQGVNVSPVLRDRLHSGNDEPAALALSPDGRTLYAGLRSVWRSANGGQAWTEIGPAVGGAVDAARPAGRISALAVSPIDARTVWAGTSNGQVHVTRDAGVTWRIATPATAPSGISGIEPSRFDANSVYITVTTANRTSRLLRTRDSGVAWTDLTASFPVLVDVRAVREDLLRRGLLFAATDQSVFFSIDDGERWQALRLNLPATPVQDVVVKDADLVIATGGRGIWVLDDFSPLRQLTPDVARSDVFLFRPAQTWRARASAEPAFRGADTNAPAPDGVALSYVVGPTLAGPVTIEVIETVTGDLIRRSSSEEARRQPGDPLLVRTPGLHRVTWDLRYTRPDPDASAPAGARVLPGTYQVRLSTSTRSIRQAVIVRMDPRVRTSLSDLAAERTLARALDARRADVALALDEFGARLATESGDARSRIAPAGQALTDLRDELRRVTRAVSGADARPSAALEAAAASALERALTALTSWNTELSR